MLLTNTCREKLLARHVSALRVTQALLYLAFLLVSHAETLYLALQFIVFRLQHCFINTNFVIEVPRR